MSWVIKAKEQCSRCSYVHSENSDRDDKSPLVSYDGLRLCPKCLEEAKRENK